MPSALSCVLILSPVISLRIFMIVKNFVHIEYVSIKLVFFFFPILFWSPLYFSDFFPLRCLGSIILSVHLCLGEHKGGMEGLRV